MTDWYTTILSLIGAEITNDDSPTDLDGADQSEALFNNKQDVTPRSIVVNELANAGISFYRGAIQNSEGWKLLNNPRYSPVVDNAYSLYNVRDDPGEEIDYKTVYPELYEEMKTIFEVIHSLLLLFKSKFLDWFQINTSTPSYQLVISEVGQG